MAEAGADRYRYEVEEGWGRLPEGWTFGNVTGVAVDSQDRVIICQQQMDPPVIVFDREGNYLNSWGSGLIPEPHTLFIDADDIVYVPDRVDHVAMKFTMDGELLLEMGNRGQPSDTGCTEPEGVVLRAGPPFNMPTRVSPSPSGNLYVSDGYKNCRVHRFSSGGDLISSWGNPGDTAPGDIRSPHSLWVMPDGRIYVCDRLNNRIQIFSPEGDFVAQWPDVSLPTDLFVDSEGAFFVAERPSEETGSNWITVRNGTGEVQAKWDTPRIHQMWIDPRGDMFIVTGAMAEPRGKAIFKYTRK